MFALVKDSLHIKSSKRFGNNDSIYLKITFQQIYSKNVVSDSNQLCI